MPVLKKAVQSAKPMTMRSLVERQRNHDQARAERIDNAAAFFGSFPENIDLQQVLNLNRRVSEQFNCIPPSVRGRFMNDPVKLLEFVKNIDNYDEACKLGLISIEAQVARERALKEKMAASAKTAGTAGPAGSAGT